MDMHRDLLIDPAAFIRENTRLAPVPSLPEIRIHTAHPASGLSRLADPEDDDPPSPYWAYPWAGGIVLAHHILDHPETVAGRRVLDLGAGSGLVGIAAARAGASTVTAAEIDRYALVALKLNAEANDVALDVIGDDLLAGPPPSVEVILVGDLFYDPDLAFRVTAFLDRCLAAGLTVLVGDPGRAWLPHAQLRRIAEYAVPDFGEIKTDRTRPSAVFAFEPDSV